MVDVVLSRIVHLVFASIWVGTVVFVALVVLPLARDGHFDAAPLEPVSKGVTRISRASALVLLVTGGHLAGTGYSVGGGAGPDLFTTIEGQLVLAMVALWAILAGLVEIGAKRFETGLAEKLVRDPARKALPFYRAGAVVAVALLVVAGAMTTGATVHLG